jgi:hypothetical protein
MTTRARRPSAEKWARRSIFVNEMHGRHNRPSFSGAPMSSSISPGAIFIAFSAFAITSARGFSPLSLFGL